MSSQQHHPLLQVGIDVTGEAVQRAGRKVAGAYKQAQDPLSHSLQQLTGLAEGAGKQTAEAPMDKQLPSAKLYHGDIATASAMKPGKCHHNSACVLQSLLMTPETLNVIACHCM